LNKAVQGVFLLSKYIVIIFSLIFILPVYSLNDFDVSSSIEWDRAEFVITLTFKNDQNLTPKTRFEAEQLAEDNISGIFLDSISDFPVDSYYTVNEMIKDNYNLLISLKGISENGKRGAAYFSSDFSSIIVSYTFPFFGKTGLINPFITHNKAFPLNRVLGFTPTENFSGIVIYAMGEYSTIGPSEQRTIKPALFPKIYDENMNIVLEKEMCNPDTLKLWGMTAYSGNLELEPYMGRIGDNPIKIMAKMVYGINKTDIVISSLNASQILGNEQNRELLVNGNILIIYDSF
jgi:hypothetical protein